MQQAAVPTDQGVGQADHVAGSTTSTAIPAAEAAETEVVSEADSGLPSPWTEAVSEAGQSYYHNIETDETSWERPVVKAIVASSQATGTL